MTFQQTMNDSSSSECSLQVLDPKHLVTRITSPNELLQNSGSVAEALAAFMRISSLAKKSLKKIFHRVDLEYIEDFEMQCADRWSKFLDLELKEYSVELHSKYPYKEDVYLMDELMFLKEACGIRLPLQKNDVRLPDVLPHAVFLNFLQKKVKEISITGEEFLGKMWNCIGEIVVKLLMHHSSSYPELEYFIRSAVQNLIARRKEESVDWVREIIGTDKLTDLISNPEYVATSSRFMAQQTQFMKFWKDSRWTSQLKINLKGAGAINVLVLRKHRKDFVQLAFELKMRMAAYWKIVFNPEKLGNHENNVDIGNDLMALERMRFSAFWQTAFGLENIVNFEIEEEIIKDLIASYGGSFEGLLAESLVAEKRFRLQKRGVERDGGENRGHD